MSDPMQPDRPGDGDPPPIIVRITSVSPVAGALAGGIVVTLTGSGFQPGADVYFGNNPSPEVNRLSSTSIQAKVPAAAQAGSVSITVFNPDDSQGTKPAAFTYVSTQPPTHAEVLGVSPLSVIEDTETEVTVTGRFLIDSYNNGVLALRAPNRATIEVLSVNSSNDAGTGIDTFVFTVHITASPTLETMERMAIQVVASRRPEAATDGVFESSKQMFTLLPRSRPVPLAYSADLKPGQENLVVVAGRNLEGCTLELGDGATVHLQSSEDRIVSGVVSVPAESFASASPRLSFRDADGVEMAQYAMWVAPAVEYAEAGATNETEETDDGGGARLKLTPVPGQQVFGPTPEDSMLFPLGAIHPSSVFFDWSNFEITIFDRLFLIPIIHEVHLIPFFDGGSGDDLKSDFPVVAQVGRLLRLRGAGILVALHVDIVIHIRIVLIIGFRFDVWGFGLFNEFPEYSWGIGSVVIGFSFQFESALLLSFLLAAVLPDGQLNVFFQQLLTISIDFDLSADRFSLRFGASANYRVNVRRIGPLASLLLCDGRFQLASENGQTVFPDQFGGHHSFYLPRSAGQCCIPWNFDLSLLRFESGKPDVTLQGGFRADFCLNAMSNPNPMDVLIVSTRTPNGFPPPLRMDVGESDFLRAMALPVDEANHPVPGPRRDLRSLGFTVQFFLASSGNTVLDPGSLPAGSAAAILPGQNVIRVAATSPPRIIDEETGQELPFGFLPSSVLGFDILSFLARGLPPAVRVGGLPVEITLPLVKVTVEPVLAYRVEPAKKDTLTASKVITHVTSGQRQNVPVWEVERSEPFLNQRRYVFAVKLTPESGRSLPPRMSLTFTVKTVTMELLPTGTNTTGAGAPLNIQALTQAVDRFKTERLSSDAGQFFTGKLTEQSQQFSITLDPTPPAGQLIEIGDSGTGSNTGLLIIPNNKEAAGTPMKLVPPGQNVGDRHVLLTVEVEMASADVQLQTTNVVFSAAVTNEETFEEYLRVLEETQGFLASSTRLSGFPAAFDLELTRTGPTNAMLSAQGAKLWDDACTEVQSSLLDDRPLYYARLSAIAALRAYCKTKPVTLTPDMIHQFEWPSRGLDTSGVIRFVGADATKSRKAIITGFDPFYLPRDPDTSNPSGLVALSLNKKTLNPNRVIFIKTDADTQGTWRGKYGGDGYNVINDTESYPSYSQVTPAGHTPFVWAQSTADVRALQKAVGTDRTAACWHGSQFTIDVNITDGRTHRVALYLLDWDGNNTRSETIEVLDASVATNDVLDTRSASAFSAGLYLVWDVSGSVRFRVTNTGGPTTNAVVSGIFFDTPAGSPDVYVRTAVFPVRYKDFEERLIENAVQPDLSSVVMVMTCSRGLSNYDVDRFAARNRGPGYIDNNRTLSHQTLPVEPPNLTTIQGVSAAQLQYLETTLPSERVITATSTRQLPAPQPGVAPFSGGPTRWFILNQSFEVLNAPPATTPGKREPYPSSLSDKATYDPGVVQKPDAGATSFQGSGSNYLSNEIFYRVALLRDKERPPLTAGERSPLATGHFHLPIWPSSPQTDGPGLLYSVRTAAERFLRSLFRMRVSQANPLPQITFTPAVKVNTTSAPQPISPVNTTKQTINVFPVEVSPPFAAQWPGPTPIPLSPGAALPLTFTFRPTTPGVHNQTAKLRDSNGELLMLISLTGEGLPTYTISGRVTVNGAALQGVLLTLSGPSTLTATTGADGRYALAGLDAGGNYTVTPSKANYTFTPVNQSFSGLAADQTADFAATLKRRNIKGRVRTAGGVAVPNATVTLTGDATGTVTTDSTGAYLFAGLPEGGKYTVWVARTNYFFPVASQIFSNLSADMDFDFIGDPVSYTINGRVTSGGIGLAGVTVALSGSQSASKVTDAVGNYSFTVTAEGSYTVTASKTNYTVAPSGASFNNLGANKTVDFTATLNLYRVGGRVSKAGGVGLGGVTVVLSGSQSGTTTTDANGNYSFANLPAGGTYTVTPSKANYTFTPAARTFNALSADQTSDFTGSLVSYTVGGRMTSGGAGLAGVTVNLGGSQTATATTDANGNYSFTVPAEGNYSVTPSKAHYSFTPQSLSFNNLSSSQSANFTATLNRHAISGRIRSTGGVALAGVTLTLSGTQSATATSDASGNYSFTNLPAGGNYTVTPSKANYTFTPASRSFSDLGADQTADFVDALVSYTIAGRVTSGGAGLGGVTVNLSGTQTSTATTAALGNYSFVVTAEGNYTVTPSKAHYTFTPSGASFNNLGANQSADLTATLNRHTISGRVTGAGGVGLAGVTVNLGGSQAATVATDANGNYSFANLPAGGNYTVAVSRVNYTFTPASRSFNDLSADQTSDFAGALVNYTITGRVTSGGVGLAGATVALSGSQSASATTDTNGGYAFTVPAEGSYTVTPSKAHYTFAPQPATFNNLGASKTADFTATLNRHTISGRVSKAGGVGLGGVTVALSGSQAGTTTTDANGNYSFINLPAGGNYTVTAARANYAFTPGTQSFSDLSADRAANFAGALVNYTVGGRVTSGGAGFAGVVVTLSGSQSSSATTDAGGNYSFSVIAEGNYTVTPSKANYTFAPQSAVFSGLGANQSADFDATLDRHKIAGSVITSTGSAVPNVTLSLSGSQAGTTTTDASGDYSFANLPAGGSYTVTPSRANYAFTPPFESVGSLGADAVADFTAALVHYILSGRVTVNGAGLADATVTLGGSETATATTDANGNYSFNVTAEGNYTVTPSKAHYTFVPQSSSFNNLGANQAADFGATLQRHTISGSVMTADGVGLSGVSVALSGPQPASTTTDASGNYSFANLPAGGDYTVTPSRANHVFTPGSRSFTDLGAEQTAHFVGAPVNYTITGRVTTGGTGLGGVTLNLSGSRTVDAVTGALGNYYFNVPAEGDYTITPYERHHTFSPEGVTFNDLTADRVADFDAALNRHTISGRVAHADGTGIPGVTIMLSGSQSEEAITDDSGSYSFADLPAGGGYTVTAARANYDFMFDTLSFDDLSANQTADFTGSLAAYRISGRVTSGGEGLAGVGVRLSGSATATATTDASGNYVFTVPAEGDYTVSPSEHYTFTPAGTTFNNLSSSQTANFAAADDRRSIGGRVTNPVGDPLPGAALTLSGSQSAATITDGDGNYSFENLQAGGNYTVTPKLFGYAFSPLNRTFNGLSADQQTDFAASPAGGVRINVGLPYDESGFSVSTAYKMGRAARAVINGDVRYIRLRGTPPDGSAGWLDVGFVGEKEISEVHVVSTQDNLAGVAEAAQELPFAEHGLQDFDVLYWTDAGWKLVPGGAVIDNESVWVKIAFPPLRTAKIRLIVRRVFESIDTSLPG